jgi:hypothetical protein
LIKCALFIHHCANMKNYVRHLVLGLLAAFAFSGATLASSPAVKVDVWKGPECECCNDWIKHMQANGFAVVSHNQGNHDVRARLGMPVKYGSCHTAQVGGYVIEGHVPASDVQRLLRERPKAVGLAVPGMKLGSPGMDGPEYGGRKDAYDVLLIRQGGGAAVYQSYR